MKRFASHAAVAFALILVAAVVASRSAASSPKADLTSEAHRLARKYLKKMGKGYTAHIDNRRHIVYVSALDDEHRRRTQNLLSAFADAQKKTLLGRPLPWNLVVILPTAEDYKKLAVGVELENSAGFCTQGGRKLVSIDRGRVLLHEFTHALHFADVTAERQTHPIWIKEGLATLFESSRITPAGLEPYVAGRLRTLHKAIRKKKTIPLDRLFRMGQKKFMKQAKLCYAQSRYVMLYLKRRGRLKSWYRDYKKNYTKDPTGLKAFERALGLRLFQIEPQWKEWVGKLRIPLDTRRSGQARLGAEVVDDPRGVKIVRLVPKSAAKTAGRLRVGDVIEKLNGVKTPNPAAFVAAVRSAGANRTVKIEIIRRGRKKTIIQPLGAPKKPDPKGKQKQKPKQDPKK